MAVARRPVRQTEMMFPAVLRSLATTREKRPGRVSGRRGGGGGRRTHGEEREAIEPGVVVEAWVRPELALNQIIRPLHWEEGGNERGVLLRVELGRTQEATPPHIAINRGEDGGTR